MTTALLETDTAACRDADPDLFFPAAHAGAEQERRVAAAKELCRGCPIRRRCLTHALEVSESEGIWGGFTARERRRLRAYAASLRALDPRVIDELQAGRSVALPAVDRPAVAHRLSRLGWSLTRIGLALGVEPWAAHTASVTGANAAFYVSAEDGRDGCDGSGGPGGPGPGARRSTG
ncbi:WhiB family transcriptional regulator [Streptomyces sp. NBC_01351]|uniref:WhiB family transcriptional regulator n=1 Tax=Streptomyces sp. NBC_01351 TaxID=2903833 RepID=UPI002E35F56C|nr:WhiB family transcriptional regulator [Streptomyces sp. NBC_01351]